MVDPVLSQPLCWIPGENYTTSGTLKATRKSNMLCFSSSERSDLLQFSQISYFAVGFGTNLQGANDQKLFFAQILAC
jgi:hypothetical protein